MKNRLIIFDCFGVIFGEVAPVFLRKHLPKEEAAIVKEKLFRPADLGIVTYDELLDNMAKELCLNKDEMIKEWNETFHLNEKIVPVIEALGKTADIALLSNAPLGLVERLFEHYGLTKLFDKMFVSSNLKMAKPDLEIYRYCVSQFEKDYDEVFMIDDNTGNLEHLHEIGITAVHYTDVESLTNALT